MTGAAAGLHLVVHPPPGHDEVALTALAVECGLDARPLSRYTVTPAARPGRVIGYGHQRPNTLAGAVVELAARLR